MPRNADIPAATARVRKNMDMDAHKLREAQEVLGTRTETETVDRALDYVVFTSEVFTALDTLARVGGLDDPYARTKSPRVRRVAER
jgi:hypothetical protein